MFSWLAGSRAVPRTPRPHNGGSGPIGSPDVSSGRVGALSFHHRVGMSPHDGAGDGASCWPRSAPRAPAPSTTPTRSNAAMSASMNGSMRWAPGLPACRRGRGRPESDGRPSFRLATMLEYGDVELNRRTSPAHLAPLAGRGRRAAPGEGDSPRVRCSWMQPLTPTLSPRRAGRGRSELPAELIIALGSLR
jgi:hypothetical protein